MSSSDSPVPTRPSYDPYDPWADEETPKTPEKTRVACVEVPGAPKKLTTKEERARLLMEAEPSPAPTEPVSFSQAEPVDADNAGVVACSGDKRKMSFDSVEMSLERPKGFVLAWYLGNVVSELGMVQCSLRSAIFAAEARKANGDEQMEFYADVARDSLEGVAEVMRMAKTGALLEHGEAHENALKEYLLREIVGEREDADVQAGIGMLGGMPEFGEMFESHAESIGRYAEDLQVALWDFKRLEVATGLKKCKAGAVGKVALKSHALPFGTLVTWFCQGTEGLPAVVVPGPLAGLEKGGVFACALLGVVNLKHPVSVELELDDYGRTWEFGFEFEGSGVDSQTVELYKLRCVLEKAKALAKEGAKVAQGAERVETYSCKVHKAYHNKVKAFVGEKGRGVVKTKADWVVLYAAGNGTVGEHLKCKPALQAAVDAVIVGLGETAAACNACSEDKICLEDDKMHASNNSDYSYLSDDSGSL